MKFLATIVFAAMLTTGAAAQPAPQPGPTKYTLELSAEDVNLIGRGIDELPAKIANPLAQRLVRQINAQNEAFRKDHEPPKTAPAEPPK